jgi:hypothetical protein
MEKNKRGLFKKVSLDRLIALSSGLMAVVGWALLIIAQIASNSAGLKSQPPVIEDFHIAREVVQTGETVDIQVFVKDPNQPEDVIKYFWAAQLGKIGEQLDRFQGPKVTYIAPDEPGIDFITIIVQDRDGGTDRDFKTVTITERKGRNLIIGNKNFTEQYIIGQLMKQLFEYHGFKVTLDSDNYSEVLRRKMEEDEIDICAL